MKKETLEQNQNRTVSENGNGIRLNKYVSEAGYCSRREADRLLQEGKILVDGRPPLLGQRILPGQEVTVNGTIIGKEEETILLAYHKPRGIVCTSETKEPNNIISAIGYEKRIYPVGRLDKDSEGLILLTNNGEIMNRILKARNYHEKEYIVSVNKNLTKEFLTGMAFGVPILDTVTRNCETQKIDDRTFRIILTQGLNRQIRRMCEYFGYQVLRLQRVRIMNIHLGKLKQGSYRKLTEKEWNDLNETLDRRIP